MSVRTAVFPVAGIGTRFLPVTKTVPKEMLPIIDRPIIQYGVEEAAAAGIERVVLVDSPVKKAVEGYFRPAPELEAELQRKGRQDLVDLIRRVLPDRLTVICVTQDVPLGLGHAVLCARQVVGAEPFAVLLPDDLIEDGQRGCLRQLLDIYDEHRCSVVAVERVPRSETRKYGIVSTAPADGRAHRMTAIVEKPEPEAAPSTLAVVGRYVFSPRIWEILERTGRGAGGEIQLTDAIAQLIAVERVMAYEFEGRRFDCGSMAGYLQANVTYALHRKDLAVDFADFLRSLDLTTLTSDARRSRKL